MLGTGAAASANAEQGRWRARPAAATAVWATTAALPIVAALGAGLAVTAWWQRPAAFGGQIAWWLASVAAAATASYVVARSARRLLPLATLLKLSLTFPDRTPSRFGLALRAGGMTDLRNRAERLASAQLPLAEAAQEALVLATAISRHDRATRGHSERVRAMTEVLARELGLPAEDRDRLRWAGLLHDVGKVAVPSTILNKPGPLTDDEWRVMRSHAAESGRLVAPLRPWLGAWTDAVTQHHERYDGSGYPDALRGEQISLGARIVAVADTFEVMTAARSYKRPLSPAVAREEISSKAGDLFDPAVARALLNVSIGRLRRVSGPLLWIAASPLLIQLRIRAASLGRSAPGSIATAAGAASGVLVAALAIGPTAPAAARAAVTAPQFPLTSPSAALPMPQTAAAASPPAAAATLSRAVPALAASASAPAPSSAAPPASVSPRVAAAARRPLTAPPFGGPTSAAAGPPLLEVSVTVAGLPVHVAASAPAPHSAALPVQIVMQLGPVAVNGAGAKP